MTEAETMQAEIKALRQRVEMLETMVKLLEIKQAPPAPLYPYPAPAPYYPSPYYPYSPFGEPWCGSPTALRGRIMDGSGGTFI